MTLGASRLAWSIGAILASLTLGADPCKPFSEVAGAVPGAPAEASATAMARH
jgi:hypothetical protein